MAKSNLKMLNTVGITQGPEMQVVFTKNSMHRILFLFLSIIVKYLVNTDLKFLISQRNQCLSMSKGFSYTRWKISYSEPYIGAEKMTELWPHLVGGSLTTVVNVFYMSDMFILRSTDAHSQALCMPNKKAQEEGFKIF